MVHGAPATSRKKWSRSTLSITATRRTGRQGISSWNRTFSPQSNLCTFSAEWFGYHSSLITLCEQTAVVLRARWRDASEPQVLFDVRAAAHADQRRCDAGRGAHELDGGLRVGRERAERFAHLFGQARRDLALQYGRAGDDRHAERLRRFEQRDVRAPV